MASGHRSASPVVHGSKTLITSGTTIGGRSGAGQVVPIIRGARACPVEAVSAWLAAAGISEGPLFRRMVKGRRVAPEMLSPHSIGAAVKRYAAQAGFKAAEFGGAFPAGRVRNVRRREGGEHIQDHGRDAAPLGRGCAGIRPPR